MRAKGRGVVRCMQCVMLYEDEKFLTECELIWRLDNVAQPQNVPIRHLRDHLLKLGQFSETYAIMVADSDQTIYAIAEIEKCNRIIVHAT